MNIKSLLMAGVLCVGSIGYAARVHDIVLGSPSMAGNVQLPAGPYSLKVKGDQAVFTNLEKDKTFTAPVKQETGTEKFDRTQVRTDTEGGTARITEIDLGGSHTKLEFQK